MRDLFKTVLTTSMVAGALLVSACGGSETTEVNNMSVDMGTTDPMMDGTTNDVTAIDGATMDSNMMMNDTNMTMDANMTDMNATMDMNAMDANMTNGM